MSRKKNIQPYWRPDFKIPSTLPDIKAVRTDFIINFIAVGLVLVFLFALIHREYGAYSLRSSISVIEQRLRDSEADNNSNLKASERFRTSAESVKELQLFFRAPFTAHELLAEVSLLKPEELIFSTVRLSESVIKPKGKAKTKPPAKMAYKINISGDVRGLTVLSEFKEALQALSLLNSDGLELLVDESIQQRDSETGITPFELSISLNPEKAKGASTKGGKG